MLVKLLVAIFFLAIHFGFAQSEKLINGTVLCEQLPVANVEVANFTSKKVVLTDLLGNFAIPVKLGEELFFISKNHDTKKIIVNLKIITTNDLTISLNLKAEQLDEVVITKMPSLKLSKDANWEQAKIDSYSLEKAASTPKVVGVYTGGIENGINLIRIGGMIIKLFRKEKDVIKKELEQIDFKTLTRSSCDKKFYLETLKLKPDEMELFLQFCDADPQSKIVVVNANVLTLMDFLVNKNIEFKKL